MGKSSELFMEERERNQFINEVDEYKYLKYQEDNLQEQEHFCKLDKEKESNELLVSSRNNKQ